ISTSSAAPSRRWYGPPSSSSAETIAVSHEPRSSSPVGGVGCLADSLWRVALAWRDVRIIGTVVGDGLQLLRELDRGVSSRVYLASDGKQVKALKLFKSDHAARAERELIIGSRLDHPHLNPVDSAVTVAGSPGV